MWRAMMVAMVLMASSLPLRAQQAYLTVADYRQISTYMRMQMVYAFVDGWGMAIVTIAPLNSRILADYNRCFGDHPKIQDYAIVEDFVAHVADPASADIRVSILQALYGACGLRVPTTALSQQ